jgi:hypothetical protein
MSEHTPGPWEIGDETYFHGERNDRGKSGRSLPLLPIRRPDERPFGREVALVWYSLKGQGPAEGTDLANARLVAAAPELLDALAKLTAIVESRFEGLEIVALVPRELRAAVKKAKAAIAKADGLSD